MQSHASWTASAPTGVASSRPLPVQGFVGGPENQLVPTALDSLLGRSAQPSTTGLPDFSPLVLCGRSGIGKSLLARCLVSNWQQSNGQGRFAFYTGKDWSRAYVQAVKDDNIAAWREDCRNVELFVIDDVAQLERQFAAQRELVLLLDDLIVQGVPIIATIPVDPMECDCIDSTIAGRLSGGLVVKLQPPGLETRRRIVEQVARNFTRPMTAEAQDWFAEQFSGSVPALQQSLLGCLARATQTKDDIDRQELRKLHAEWLQQRSVSLKAITKSVSRYCQIPVKDMIGVTRRHSIVQARSLAMYLAKQLSGESLRTIGQHFGGRDHTTVLHACQKLESNQATDPALRTAIDELTQILNGNHGDVQ